MMYSSLARLALLRLAVSSSEGSLLMSDASSFLFLGLANARMLYSSLAMMMY